MTPRMPRPSARPTRMPGFADNPWRRACRALLRLGGWSLDGELPDCARLVLIGAPHSSWWDGVWGLLMKVGLGANVHFMIKRELFQGPLGWLLHALGGVPIDRHAAAGVVEQMVARFARSDALWLLIT